MKRMKQTEKDSTLNNLASTKAFLISLPIATIIYAIFLYFALLKTEISTCEDGQQAVEYYQEHFNEIDFVILDIMMPNLDGYSCLRELKKINPDVLVIIASGYTINGMATDLKTEGAKAFIQKPFDTIRLSRAIDKAQLS